MGETAPAASLLHSEPEIEKALLGRIIAGWGMQRIPPPRLAPSRFASLRNQAIWGAILDAHRKGEPYDLPALVSRLKAAGHLADAGGAAYVAALLTGKEGSPDSIDFYVQKIRQAAARRAFGPLGAAVAALALEDTAVDPPSIKERYHSLIRRADAVCDMASRNGHNPTLTIKTIHQILTTPADALSWIYEPWLGAGEMVVLAGEPGLGKSWVALDLAIRAGLGKPFAGIAYKPADKFRVLYVDEENNYRLIRHRIGKIIDGLDIGFYDIDPSRFSVHYSIENGINFDDPDSLAKLQTVCQQLQPNLIVLDSLVRVHRRDENSNADMSALIGGTIKPMARQVGAACLIIHHLAKPGKDRPSEDIHHRIRGASDIMGVADQVWGLQRKDECLILSHLKCRMDRQASSLELTIEDTHAGNGVVITARDQQLETSEIVRYAVMLAAEAGIIRKDVVSAVEKEGFSQASRLVSRHLAKMRADGIIKRRKEGQSTRYWLADLAPPDSE